MGLVAKHLLRIAQYDRRGPTLNAIPVSNTNVLDDAQASDDLRAKTGKARSPLEGIPVTIKDSYKIKGMTLAAGSHAFQHLIANEDAFTVSQIKHGGGIILGRTNMPPMAAGGMQRGVYGRAESPYNGDYLTAAFASGSSNGSGTATAASLGAIGMGRRPTPQVVLPRQTMPSLHTPLHAELFRLAATGHSFRTATRWCPTRGR